MKASKLAHHVFKLAYKYHVKVIQSHSALAQCAKVEHRLSALLAANPSHYVGCSNFTKRTIILSAPITKPEHYAIALHELGHIASLNQHHLRTATEAARDQLLNNGNIMKANEIGAWKWAKATALYWTPVMEAQKERCLSTYGVSTKTKKEQVA